MTTYVLQRYQTLQMVPFIPTCFNMLARQEDKTLRTTFMYVNSQWSIGKSLQGNVQ